MPRDAGSIGYAEIQLHKATRDMATAKKPAFKTAAAKSAPAAAPKAFPGLEKDFKKLAARALAELQRASVDTGAQGMFGGNSVALLGAYISQYKRWLQYRTLTGKTNERIANESCAYLESCSDALKTIELRDELFALIVAGKPTARANAAHNAAVLEVRAKRQGVTVAELKKQDMAESDWFDAELNAARQAAKAEKEKAAAPAVSPPVTQQRIREFNAGLSMKVAKAKAAKALAAAERQVARANGQVNDTAHA